MKQDIFENVLRLTAQQCMTVLLRWVENQQKDNLYICRCGYWRVNHCMDVYSVERKDGEQIDEETRTYIFPYDPDIISALLYDRKKDSFVHEYNNYSYWIKNNPDNTMQPINKVPLLDEYDNSIKGKRWRKK